MQNAALARKGSERHITELAGGGSISRVRDAVVAQILFLLFLPLASSSPWSGSSSASAHAHPSEREQQAARAHDVHPPRVPRGVRGRGGSMRDPACGELMVTTVLSFCDGSKHRR